MATDDAIGEAAAAVARGGLVVYPTETVYGLGADATDAAAVERVYEAKRRPRENPLSAAFPGVEAALEYTRPTSREEAFMRAFLPGPVTVVVERTAALPDALTAGRDRVGVRVPDCAPALRMLERTAPVTATSANVSGRPSVTRVADLDDRIRERAAVVVDGGETPGTESTVVDPGSDEVLRRGELAADVEAWLDGH
jgi:L-threonylcarbamoyladenylate synthase